MAVQLAHVVLQNDQNNTEAQDVLVLAPIKSNNQRFLNDARIRIKSATANNPINEKLLLSEISKVASEEVNLSETAEVNLSEIAIPVLEAYCQTPKGSSSVEAIVTLADLYRIIEEMDTAKQWIEKAEGIDPSNQIVVHARFLWLVAMKQFSELSDISSVYLSATKQDSKTLMNAASILIGLDSLALKKEGIKLYDHAATLSTSTTSTTERMNVASTLYQTGNFERAENIYRELLGQYPNHIRILNDLAWILQEHYKKYNEALELTNRGLSISPNNLNLLDTRGTILLNLPDRLPDARDDFQKLAKLLPTSSPQRAKELLQLGRICEKLNDLEQAKRHLQQAIEIEQAVDVKIFTLNEMSEIKRILQRSEP
jgi:tetratricopeptide (TPR) repeat protein